MAFGINSGFYNALHYLPIWDCGSGLYGDAKWFANTLTIQKARFNLGTYSGNVTFDYITMTGSSNTIISYTNNSSSLAAFGATSGSTNWAYTYDGTSSIVDIDFVSRELTTVDQWLKVKVSCPTSATSLLTFLFYSAGVFVFNLTDVLSEDLTVSVASVTGSDNDFCGSLTEFDSIVTNCVIPSGSFSGNGFGGTPMSCDIISWQRDAYIMVNGEFKASGDTIVIGGTIVTISIPSDCVTPYAC